MRAALGVAVVLAALVAVALLGAGRLLVVADPLPPRADAIVILAGSVPDRTLEAADLYRAGLAPRVVVTRERLPRGQAALRARGVRLPESDELTVTALRELGVPPGAIVVLHRRGVSTESEARTIARWACARRLRRLIVVTSRAHSRRARLILRQALGRGIALAMHPSRYDAFAPARWWRVRRDAKIVLSEYEKLANYWLTESWRIAPCGGLRRSPASAPDRRPQQRRELPARMHLAHDVAPADELPAHVHLRDRRPVGEALDRLALLRLGEHVDRLEGHADLSQHLHRGGREAAHREARRPLHVDDDLVVLHLARDLVQHVGHPRSLLRHRRAQRQRVNLRHEGAEDPVDHLVLLDERLAAEGRRPHAHLEVVAGAGRIGDLDLRAGQRRLDAAADLVGARHRYASVGWYTLAPAHARAASGARAGTGRPPALPILGPRAPRRPRRPPAGRRRARGPAGV